MGSAWRSHDAWQGGSKTALLQAADINVTFARAKRNATLGISISGVATVFIDYTVSTPYARVGIYDGMPK